MALFNKEVMFSDEYGIPGNDMSEGIVKSIVSCAIDRPYER